MLSTVNVIRFELRPTVGQPASLAVWIDGVSLIETILRLEAPWWLAIDAPQPEGQYAWVSAHDALPPSRHLLGYPTDGWCGEFSPVVVCNCGEYVCRAYAVRIEVSEQRVMWSEWAEFPSEEPRLSGLLQPLAFELNQYIVELQRVTDEYRTSSGVDSPQKQIHFSTASRIHPN